jgi:hypothetical protein
MTPRPGAAEHAGPVPCPIIVAACSARFNEPTGISPARRHAEDPDSGHLARYGMSYLTPSGYEALTQVFYFIAR